VWRTSGPSRAGTLPRLRRSRNLLRLRAPAGAYTGAAAHLSAFPASNSHERPRPPGGGRKHQRKYTAERSGCPAVLAGVCNRSVTGGIQPFTCHGLLANPRHGGQAVVNKVLSTLLCFSGGAASPGNKPTAIRTNRIDRPRVGKQPVARKGPTESDAVPAYRPITPGAGPDAVRRLPDRSGPRRVRLPRCGRCGGVPRGRPGG
jgi:hypothetical protein